MDSPDQRCASCAWWDHLAIDDDHNYGPPVPHLRSDDGSLVLSEEHRVVIAPGRWGWCKKVAEFGPGTSDKFYVVDGSEYIASLSCREDFGCVEWEAR